MTKKQRIAYWVVTGLFLLPMAGSGVPELFVGGPAATAATIVHLGYPLYVMRILGFAKILGAVASHLVVGDGPVAAAPAVMLALVLSSYRLYSHRGVLAPM